MWYSANLLFRSIHTVPGEEDLWEESIRLIKADTKEEALMKAQDLGRKGEVGYIAGQDDTVKWEFAQVERVYEILDESLSNGSELFSRFLRCSEIRSLLTPFAD